MILERKGKRIFIILMILIFNCFSCQSEVPFHDIVKFQNENEKLILYKDKKFTGSYIKIFDTLKIVTTVRNGIILNIKEIGPNHKRFTKIKNNKVEENLYDINSNLISKGFFSEDRKDGKWTYYYPNGSIKKMAFFNKGKKINLWKFFNLQGKIQKKIKFENEIPLPLSKTQQIDTLKLSNNFNKEAEYVLNNDELFTGYAIGINKNLIFYIENGIFIFSKMYKDDNLYQYNEVNQNLEKQGDFFELFKNGKIKIRGTYNSNKKDEEWTEYYNSGIVKQISKYQMDIPREWWFFFSPQGDQTGIEIYSDGKLELIGKSKYLNKSSNFYDISTIFYDAESKKALNEKVERHFLKNNFVITLDYKDL